MSAKQRKMFVGMTHVAQDYAGTGLTDSKFAELISKRTGDTYSTAEIRQYRQSLGIANNAARDARDEKIAQLKELAVKIVNETLRRHGPQALTPEIIAEYNELVLK